MPKRPRKARLPRTGPLRKIVRVVVRAGGLYQQDVVVLECGHRVKSKSRNRAHCSLCRLQQEMGAASLVITPEPEPVADELTYDQLVKRDPN